MTQIKVKVKVGKPNSRIVSKDNIWIVELKSRAEDNKANNELVKLVSKELKQKAKIVHGFKSKEKIVEIF